MEVRLLGIEDTIEEMDTKVKENDKQKKLTPDIQENDVYHFHTMKRPNIKVVKLEEEEEYQLKDPENVLNKNIEENFLNLKKGCL